MAEIRVAENVPVPVDRAWELVSDLGLFEQWLSLHDGWRSDLPTDLAVGIEVTSVIKAKGIRNKISWTITEFDPPTDIRLSGTGVGGTAVVLRFSLVPEGSGTSVTLDVEFTHPMLKGPMGAVAARTIKGDLRASMTRLAALA